MAIFSRLNCYILTSFIVIIALHITVIFPYQKQIRTRSFFKKYDCFIKNDCFKYDSHLNCDGYEYCIDHFADDIPFIMPFMSFFVSGLNIFCIAMKLGFINMMDRKIYHLKYALTEYFG